MNIVLVNPEIPNNTGNIGRLALGSGCKLHLIKPLGFEIDDTRLKRAGLDYWKHLKVKFYDNWESFIKQHQDKDFAFLSSHASKNYYNIPYKEDHFLVFGKESQGLPEKITKKYTDHLYKIPLHSNQVRSLNLANAVGIVIYEGNRQLGKF